MSHRLHKVGALIRVSMRTAVDIQVTSFGTFLSSLCQEFSHCLDHRRFGFCGDPRREDPPS